MKKVSSLLWGLILVGIGVIFGLKALDIIDINIFFDGWWTMFIIIPCFIDIFKSGNKTANIIGLLIGICLLLGCQQVIRFDMIWKLILPTILVIIGISIIFKDTINGKIKKEVKKLNKNNLKEYCATFGGQTVEFNKEKFEGCNLTAVFGGVELNLKNAIIKEDVVINTSAIFGGITIYVPEDINVKITSTPIFGGVSDERQGKKKEANITLYINALSMFGGVSIK